MTSLIVATTEHVAGPPTIVLRHLNVHQSVHTCVRMANAQDTSERVSEMLNALKHWEPRCSALTEAVRLLLMIVLWVKVHSAQWEPIGAQIHLADYFRKIAPRPNAPSHFPPVVRLDFAFWMIRSVQGPMDAQQISPTNASQAHVVQISMMPLVAQTLRTAPSSAQQVHLLYA